MAISKKIHFLINPVSGGGQGKVVFEFLPEIMRSMDFKEEEWQREFSVYESFEEQVKEALASSECVIAVGGDGTATAVFNVLLCHQEFKHVKIGIIPLGTGNDLARVLNLYDALVSRGLLYIVRKLVSARARNFDLWKVNGKFAMANYFSAGIDARIAHDFNRDRAEGKITGKSVIKNKLHYVKRFFADKDYRLKAGELYITDKHNERKIFPLKGNCSIIIGNIPSYAGGSNPFGKSDIADGLLEVLLIKSLKGFLKAISIGAGSSVIKAKKAEINLANDEFIQLDGEDFSGKLEMPIHIEFGGTVEMLYL
jgi:Sphingosine kinase and enzymes related to eukaryotic diacylglycerol kinase